METNAAQLAEKLRKIEKSDSVSYRQKAAALAARVRLEKLESMYRTAINEVMEDLETVKISL